MCICFSNEKQFIVTVGSLASNWSKALPHLFWVDRMLVFGVLETGWKRQKFNKSVLGFLGLKVKRTSAPGLCRQNALLKSKHPYWGCTGFLGAKGKRNSSPVLWRQNARFKSA